MYSFNWFSGKDGIFFTKKFTKHMAERKMWFDFYNLSKYTLVNILTYANYINRISFLRSLSQYSH